MPLGFLPVQAFVYVCCIHTTMNEKEIQVLAKVLWAKHSKRETAGSDNGPMGDDTRTVERMDFAAFSRAMEELRDTGHFQTGL